MNSHSTSIVRQLRELMPTRRLSDFEARSVAERQATKLLQLLEIAEPPVDVSLIADLPRIAVTVAALKQGMSGETEWRDGRWHITVRRNDSTMRRRFTLGHEFKHILDHPTIRVAYGDQRDERAQQRAERMCDYFAACLLMPRAWVKREWGLGNQRPMMLARQFRVSEEAMRVRLDTLGLANDNADDDESDDQSPHMYFRCERGVSFAPVAA